MTPTTADHGHRADPTATAARRTPADVERQSFADADLAHTRPAKRLPEALLYRLQSTHGAALHLEHDARDAGDVDGAGWAHSLVVRLAEILWPVTV